MPTQTFPMPVVLSLVTGKSLCSFNAMHEAAEWVVGHPIWTHEFADRALWASLQQAVCDQFPELSDIDPKAITTDNWRAVLDELTSRFGASRDIQQGVGRRNENPLDSFKRIAGDKPVMAIVADSHERP